MVQLPQHENRLIEIAHTPFGELSDDQVLQILAERKQLQTLKIQYVQVQDKQEKLTQAKQVKEDIEKDLATLNALISPDKPDEDLIHLIEKRKILEAKLEKAITQVKAFGGAVGETSEAEGGGVAPQEAPLEILVEKNVPEKQKLSLASDDEDATVASREVLPEIPLTETILVEQESETVTDEMYGKMKIGTRSLSEGSNFYRYLERIKGDPNSIGKILESLPADAKKNKLFMLEVAKIDAAYAMHYADPDVLKKDKEFNVKVITTKSEHHSRGVLAEMLPEMRTAEVVMAAIKQDYRNVRYALPQMEGYDEMLEKAKKAAMDKVKNMKESVDYLLLIPKILQKDKSFMKKILAIVPKA